MENLILNKQLWDFNFPWGNSPENYLCNMQSEEVIWLDNEVRFNTRKKVNTGWYRDSNGQVQTRWRDYQCGQIISKQKFHFGVYEWVCKLPDFRGSWCALWLININGCPPEIDIEHFRKDGFLTRFHITHSFHQGPTYANNTLITKTYWKLWPLDMKEIELTFIWQPGEMKWIVNGKNIMKLSI